MPNLIKKAPDTNNIDDGFLRISIAGRSNGLPIRNARISISYSSEPDRVIEEVRTDESGNSEEILLSAPPLEFSMEPSDVQPYSNYTLSVEAEGYAPRTVSGISILPTETSLQKIELDTPDAVSPGVNPIVIPAHTLYGNFPPKIPEPEVVPVTETGQIVLSRVVIPEYVIVHDGVPNDNTAADYYVRYKDYIKNVASSEIYATWPDATLRANILAILSFTLNRVYTEFYRGKNFNFTITSSTAYDHKFVYGRNIFSNISRIVDEMFENYLSRPNVRQPILTQYCDGKRVSCPGWMTQWGSKDLGDQGYSAIEILRYFYGSDMYINVADQISGIPASWPGYTLTVGSRGDKVAMIQRQLNRIAQNYPAIPTVNADGIYGPKTSAAVSKFQSVFGLPVTGEVDYRTWYAISNLYVAVTRIAELY